MRHFLFITAIAFVIQMGHAQANSLLGTWQGEVDLYIEDEYDDTDTTIVEIQQNESNDVTFEEDFYGDVFNLKNVDGKLFEDNEEVGTINDQGIFFDVFYMYDEDYDTDCYVQIASSIDADGELDYYNEFYCDDGYVETLSGWLEKSSPLEGSKSKFKTRRPSKN